MERRQAGEGREVAGAGSGGTGWPQAQESQDWGSRSEGMGWLQARESQGWGSRSGGTGWHRDP